MAINIRKITLPELEKIFVATKTEKERDEIISAIDVAVKKYQVYDKKKNEFMFQFDGPLGNLVFECWQARHPDPKYKGAKFFMQVPHELGWLKLKLRYCKTDPKRFWRQGIDAAEKMLELGPKNASVMLERAEFIKVAIDSGDKKCPYKPMDYYQIILDAHEHAWNIENLARCTRNFGAFFRITGESDLGLALFALSMNRDQTPAAKEFVYSEIKTEAANQVVSGRAGAPAFLSEIMKNPNAAFGQLPQPQKAAETIKSHDPSFLAFSVPHHKGKQLAADIFGTILEKKNPGFREQYEKNLKLNLALMSDQETADRIEKENLERIARENK